MGKELEVVILLILHEMSGIPEDMFVWVMFILEACEQMLYLADIIFY